MAPEPESVYFPLEKCLNGDHSILSWRSAFHAITNGDSDSLVLDSPIRSFFADNEVKALLAKPFDTFILPSAQTKSSFEQRTSAINVTPSANSRYDLKQIKEDVLWLSEAVSVDHVSALRVAIVECQNRANTQLLGPFTQEELTGIREAAGSNKYSSTIPLALLSQAADPEESRKDFESETSRKKRLLDTYLVERDSFLATFNYIIQSLRLFQARELDNVSGKLPQQTPSWVEALGLELVERLGPATPVLSRSFEMVQQGIKDFEKGCGGFNDEATKDELDLPWGRAQLTQIILTMEAAFDIVLSNPEATSSKNILEWFRMVNSYKYFSSLGTADPTLQALHIVLQSFTSVISLALFKAAQTIDLLSDTQIPLALVERPPGEEQYFLNKATIYQIQALVQNVADEPTPIASAGPAMLAWSAILSFLQARVYELKSTTSGRDQVDQSAVEYEDVLEQIFSKDVENPIDSLARQAVNECRVFEILSELSLNVGSTSHAHYAPVVGARMQLVLLDLLQQTTIIGYLPEVVEALISILRAGQSYWDRTSPQQLPESLDPAVVFLRQEELINAFLQNATSRYPFESAPFLQLIRALASSPNSYQASESQSILDFLNEVPVLTFQLPENFRDYETVQEEDNNNNIRLLQPINLFAGRNKSLSFSGSHNSSALVSVDNDFTLQAGTNGRIVSDSGPRVVIWFHKYSALRYFGKLLETYLIASNLVDTTTGRPAERDSVSEIIEILASILSGLSRSSSPDGANSEAINVLQQASAGLSRNRDIISVIFDIFEEELQRISGISRGDVPTEVLISCVRFIHALLPIYPRRVWPLLSQSKLIDTGRGGGRLAAIVESAEIVSGQYEFLLSCSHLYQAAVEEIVVNTVRRKVGNRATARYSEVNDFETGISDQILSRTLILFTKYFVEALESSCTWKFVVPNQRRQLITIVSTTFDRILQYTFGLVHNSDDSAHPLVGNLSPAASIILDNFLSSASGTLRFQSFLRTFYDGLENLPHAIFKPASDLWATHVITVLTFSSTLLRVGTLLNRTTTQLEGQMFRCAPIIARLFGINESFRVPALKLLGALVLAATNNTSEPPSLLAHLGSHTSRNLIRVLSDVDKPLLRTSHVSAIWHFLSVVTSNRQQWFSNYLLTGKTPKAALQKEEPETGSTRLEKPFLTIVLEKLSNIKRLPQTEALSILRFLVLAQNFWPWTVYGSDKYADFIKSLLEYMGELSPIQQTKDQLQPIYQTRIAAYIGEIVAMYLFHSRQTGATIDYDLVETNLEYFTRFATEVPTYNPSLHSNLKQNFTKRYNGAKIQDFQRTALEDRELGRNYFYDQQLTEKMLSFDAGWSGKRDDGLRNDVALTNLNLSLVDSQIALFQSWKILAIELSNKLSTREQLHELLSTVANKCLISNSRPQPAADIFASLSQTRAELALILAQRLVQAGYKGQVISQLVNHVWDNIRTLRGSFDRSLVDSEIPYYRTLLKLLYLALRVHGSQASASDFRSSVLDPASSSLVPTLLDILKYVVAAGVRELALSLHSASPASDTTSSTEDLSLLTGILQAILHIPQVELHSATLVNIFSAASTARVATTLFSWSDTLAVNGDPIYGELSLLFLLELSSIQPMAEQMAIDGVLGQIAAANITNYLRSGQVGPFVDSAGAQRCYGIWVRGILPFLLNLLDSVQIPIASEISLFLSQFPSLLAQSSQAFDSPETNRLLAKGQARFITLTSCAEAHSLSLIHHVLTTFKREIGGEGIVDLEWDAAGVSENVDWWLSSRAILRERIVPMGDKEVEWSRRKGKNGEGSVLEDKIIAELQGTRSVLGSKD